MAGWVLDIFLEYLGRVLMRIANLIRTRSWPTVAGKVSSSAYVKAGFGCDIVEIHYKYRVEGRAYTGIHKKPWLGSLGEDYVARFPAGTELIIRIQSGNPSISVMDRAGSVAEQAARAQSN